MHHPLAHGGIIRVAQKAPQRASSYVHARRRLTNGSSSLQGCMHDLRAVPDPRFPCRAMLCRDRHLELASSNIMECSINSQDTSKVCSNTNTLGQASTPQGVLDSNPQSLVVGHAVRKSRACRSGPRLSRPLPKFHPDTTPVASLPSPVGF